MNTKEEGQAASLAGISEQCRKDFSLILSTMPGLFSANDCRDRMDLAQIPASARGGLFAGAVTAGLIAPYCPAGYQARVQSTGPSAHRATVVLYQRITKAAAA